MRKINIHKRKQIQENNKYKSNLVYTLQQKDHEKNFFLNTRYVVGAVQLNLTQAQSTKNTAQLQGKQNNNRNNATIIRLFIAAFVKVPRPAFPEPADSNSHLHIPYLCTINFKITSYDPFILVMFTFQFFQRNFYR